MNQCVGAELWNLARIFDSLSLVYSSILDGNEFRHLLGRLNQQRSTYIVLLVSSVHINE
jgi:hypothetical protein